MSWRSRTSAGWWASGCTCCRRSAGGSSQVPLGLDLPVLDRGPGLRPGLPHPRVGGPAAGRRPPARRDGGADLRPAAGPQPPAVGALPDPRTARRAGGAADEDPSLGRRRRLGQRDPHRAARPGRRRGGRSRRAAARCTSACPATSRCSAAALLGVARQPLRALRSVPTTLPNVTELPGATVMPGRPDVSRAVGRLRSAVTRQDARGARVHAPRGHRGRRSTARSRRTGASRSASSPSTRSSSSRTPSASRSTTSSSRCAPARCASGCWSATRCRRTRSSRMVPVSVRTEEEKGAYGNRISMMIVADPDRRGRSARAAAAHARAAAQRARSATRPCRRTC